MGWTNPITWSVSQVVTAANLNTQVRDNENFLRTFHGARMWQNAALSQTTSGSNQLITWDTLDYDTDSISSLSADKFIVPTGFDGTWRITASAEIANNTTGARIILIVKNESYTGRTPNGIGTSMSILRIPATMNQNIGGTVEWTGPLVATDSISIQYNQASGGSLAFNPGQALMWTEAHYLGS